jgi:hypothetical protein
VDKRGPLVRLSHFYTGRLLKNWVNVCKLRKLNDEPRHVLYNRLRSDPTNSTTVENVAQRTVQTADTDAVQCAMNARDRTDSFVGEHGPRSMHAVQQPDTPGESFMEDCRRSAVVPWLLRVDGRHAQSGLRTSQARCQLREVEAFSSQLTVPRCAVGRVDADAVTGGSCGRAPCAHTVDGVVSDDCQTWLQRTRSCTPAAEERCRSCGSAADDRVGLSAVFVQRSPYAAPIDGKPSDYACSGSGQSNGISLEQWPTIASRQAQPSAETKAHYPQGCNGQVGDEQAALTGRVHTSANLQQDSVGDSLQMRPTVPAVIYSIADKATAERGTQAAIKQSNNSDTAASSNTECTRTAAETKQPKVTQADAAQTKRASSESDGRKTTTAVANANGSYTAVSPPVREACYNYCIVKISARKRGPTQPLFRAHFNDGSKSCWVPLSCIPPSILATFYVKSTEKSVTL